MSEWDGIERRQNPVTDCRFGAVYDERFINIQEDLRDTKTKVDQMHPKVMNGLSEVPKKINWLIGILITLGLAILGTMSTWMVRTVRVEEQVDAHAQRSMDVLERVVNQIDNLDQRMRTLEDRRRDEAID
jgi:demethoxyubiquinone hydroxylase (CLK1/Coq7/Cat5 family)